MFVAAFTAGPGAALAGDFRPEEEERMVALVNGYRAGQGVTSLTPNQGLLEMARRHSLRMLAVRDVFHSADLRGQAMRVVPNWELLGENVGMLGDMPDVATAIDWLDDGFRRSPSHNRNLVEPRFTQIAVGAVVSEDGTVFVTVLFAELDAVARPAAVNAPRSRPRVERAPGPARPAPVRAPLAIGYPTPTKDPVVASGPWWFGGVPRPKIEAVRASRVIEGKPLAASPHRSGPAAWLKALALVSFLCAARFARPQATGGPAGRLPLRHVRR